jgi:glycosyltransferase involved in cell wall biosynthesis
MAIEDRRPPIRALLANQGVVGSTVLGHLATERALRLGLEGTGIETRFERLPPWSTAARLAARRIPPLDRVDLDLHQLRWHLAESVRGRRAIRRWLREAPADVVHLNTHAAGLLLGRLPRDVPLVLAVDVPIREWQTMLSSGAPWSGAALEPSARLERAAFARAAMVLTYSDWATAAVRRRMPQAHVRTLHPGIDVERYRPVAREPRAVPRVLFVGGRFAQKGGSDLLSAIGDRLGRTIELDVVTAQPPRPRAGMRLHQLTGADPRLLHLFQQADLLCLPTYVDALPWTLIEAMACGTPVVVTGVGAIPEIVEGDRAGRLVQPGDVAGLRAAIDTLLSDRSLREACGAGARAIVEQRYDARRQGRLLAACFAEVLDVPEPVAAA